MFHWNQNRYDARAVKPADLRKRLNDDIRLLITNGRISRRYSSGLSSRFWQLSSSVYEDGTGAPGFGTAEEEPVLFPMAVGRMAFSTGLLSISTWARSV